MTNPNDNAFPLALLEIIPAEVHHGMTKRELIAALICARDGVSPKEAVEGADLLIHELNKEKST